jgi:hypothetical protein
MFIWFFVAGILVLALGAGVWYDHKRAMRGTREHRHSDEAMDAYRNRKARPDDYQGWR